MRPTPETRHGSPSAQAPSPALAHQRRPSAGAETSPTLDPALALEREQRPPDGDAADVVPRAVDRVDDPAVWRAVVAELLAEHALAGPPAGDERADRLLGRPVGLADGRQVGLRLDAQVGGAEASERDRVGGVGELVREAEVGAHGSQR